jgi:hypothetical protein
MLSRKAVAMKGNGQHLRRVGIRGVVEPEDGADAVEGALGAEPGADDPSPGDAEAGGSPPVPAGAGGEGLLAALVGAIGLAIATLEGLLRSLSGAEPPAEGGGPVGGTGSMLVAAGAGLAVDAVRASTLALRSVAEAARPAAAFVTERTVLGLPLRTGMRWLAERAEAERADQRARERTAAALLDAMIPRVATAVIEQIDLDDIVRRVDIQGVIDRADVNGIIAKADLDRIVARLDLDGIVARVDIGRIIDRIDIDAIAARIDIGAIIDRVDINAIADRVDIQEILNRVDLAAVTREVMDEVDMGEIIRESTGSITTETVDAIRYQGMNADRFVSKIVDRVLLRKAGRESMGPIPLAAPEVVTPPPASNGTDAPADRT